MRRNKRCLLAYHRSRTEKLEELVWNGSDVLETSVTPDREHPGGSNGSSADVAGGDVNAISLSPEEEEYVRQYSDLLAAYKGQWTDIDLTGSLEPPRDLFIDARVLKDVGEIQTEYGYVGSRLLLGNLGADSRSRAITLTKNSQFYVRQGDVERLIAQGYLQKLG
jgi:GINS complex subunit 1